MKWNETGIYGKEGKIQWEELAKKFIALNTIGINISVEQDIDNICYITIDTQLTDGVWKELRKTNITKSFEHVSDDLAVYKINGDYTTAIKTIEEWLKKIQQIPLIKMFELISLQFDEE